MKLIKWFLDRVDIVIIYQGKKYSVNCKRNIKLKSICNKLNCDSNYLYSLFNHKYYSCYRTLLDTNIKSGDILFI